MNELNKLLKRYKILLYWSEDDGAYLAEMPELPGCITDGATPEAALANLREAAALWIETALELGRPIPTPVAATESVGTRRKVSEVIHTPSTRTRKRQRKRATAAVKDTPK